MVLKRNIKFYFENWYVTKTQRGENPIKVLNFGEFKKEKQRRIKIK